MKYAVKSDKGMIREINEDSCNVITGYMDIPPTFIIADGMGGHNSGEIASKTAVDFCSDYIIKHPELLTVDAMSRSITEIIQKANEEVYRRSRQDDANHGMGTTLIVAVVLNNTLYIGHIGDSRVYLIRKNKVEKVTVDHSLIEEMIISGTLTREEAQNHPRRNVITRAVGCFENVQVDTYTLSIEEGDSFLMCTDGLTNMLGEDDILKIIEGVDDPRIACEQLVDMANKKGGEDNTTVILVKKY